MIRKRHPHAIQEDGETGFYGIMAGERIVVGGKHGWLDEALCDGDAYVSFDDGTFATVRWNAVEREKP